MASVAFLDDSFAFTGASLRAGPLGGVQSATVLLAEALAAHGHKVAIRGMVGETTQHEGVVYRPLGEPGDATTDLVVANRAPKLLRGAAGRQRALWLHNPANYLRKPRHVLPYLRYQPAVVFVGAYHRTTWLPWLPLFRPHIIPYGVGPPFTTAPPAAEPPPPRAIFTSNPRRGLDWLLVIWVERIRPQLPRAELHIYAGRGTYGDRQDDALDRALALAQAAAPHGVIVHAPLGKDALAQALGQARVMLYRGDDGETFCGAAAEAQAMGVPLVTAGIGSLAERVTDGVTGFVRADAAEFATAALRVMRDDDLWRQQHRAALATRGATSWEHCAIAWERAFDLL